MKSPERAGDQISDEFRSPDCISATAREPVDLNLIKRDKMLRRKLIFAALAALPAKALARITPVTEARSVTPFWVGA